MYYNSIGISREQRDEEKTKIVKEERIMEENQALIAQVEEDKHKLTDEEMNKIPEVDEKIEIEYKKYTVTCEICAKNEDFFKQKRTVLAKKEDFLNKTYLEVAEKEIFLEQKCNEVIEHEEFLNQIHLEFKKKEMFLRKKCIGVLEKEIILNNKCEEIAQKKEFMKNKYKELDKVNEILKQKCSEKCVECVQKVENFHELIKQNDLLKYDSQMKEAYDKMSSKTKHFIDVSRKDADTKRILEATLETKQNAINKYLDTIALLKQELAETEGLFLDNDEDHLD
ncbi:uncharacterized protein LOC110933651 [Helianthus annuus]|uniref:uncharacterized protein LOC110933651 n=1 Tax=Helianthus annuus TaxID=4232 RepID=UPI000B8FB67D|nr:uncharacterized protein LOC110933651 [Helianthus annuus]